MSQIKDNYAMKGMSGKLADLLVYRQWFGRTIVAKPPRKVSTISAAQQAVRDKFKLATAYAAAAIVAPATSQIYKDLVTPGISAFNVALADYFNAPVIADIPISTYTGSAGDRISIPVTDDVMVRSVHVAITHANGSLVEQGLAIADLDGLHWVYTVTQANASLSGSRITVTAKDLPGNTTVDDKLMP
jgi:hypothetical protein